MSKKKKNMKNRVVNFHLNNLILDENNHARFSNTNARIASWLAITKPNQWLLYNLTFSNLSSLAIPIDRHVLDLLWPYHGHTINIEVADYDEDSARKLFGGMLNYRGEGTVIDALGFYAFTKSVADWWIPDWWPNSIPEIKGVFAVERSDEEEEKDNRKDITKVFDRAIDHIREAYCDKNSNAFYISECKDSLGYTPASISHDYSNHMKSLREMYRKRPKKTRLMAYRLTANSPIYAYQTKFTFRLLLDTTIVNLKFLGFEGENSDSTSIESDVMDILEPMDKTLYLNAATLAFLNWIGRKGYMDDSTDRKSHRYYHELKNNAIAAYCLSITYEHDGKIKRTNETVDCFPVYSPPMLDSVVYAAARFANANRPRILGDYDVY